MPGAFPNSVNERQKVRGANPEQNKRLDVMFAQEQSLAVDKEIEIEKGKKPLILQG